MLRKKERAGIIVGESAAFLICLIFLVQVFATKAGQLNLVPLPAKVTQFPGQFSLDAKTIVTADSMFTNEAALLANELHLPYVMDVPTSTSENQIRLTMQKSKNLGDEAYRLEVNQQGVTVHAHTAAGAFYGCQTLKQLVKTDTRQIPSVRIEDAPRYVWRGMMLDVSRHFFDEQTVRQMLDWMADYKLNRLHLHLTDDQAWRLEISRYPELTQIGARGNYTDSNAPAHYFTRSQMLEIIAYAAQRHIVVVPEIDLPGHADAATRTFPQLDGGAHTFNPAQPETYDFLQNVLRETMDIFPSQWIHLGGDEVDLTGWNQRADIAKKLHRDGLNSPSELEDHFVNRMAKFIESQGRTPMGWDEIAAGAPEKNTVIFWWRHDKPEILTQTLASGYSVVLTPRTPCYFDYPQNNAYPKIGWKLTNTPESVYAGPTIPTEISVAQRKQILGVEGCLWSEHIATVAYLQFMTMPRLAALAEMAWTPDAQRDFVQFSERLKPFLDQYRRVGIHYYDENNPLESLRAATNFNTLEGQIAPVNRGSF